MTDPDPRLEAVRRARKEFWASYTIGDSDAMAAEFLAMLDAVRTFDRAQRKAEFEAAHPRCETCGQRRERTSSEQKIEHQPSVSLRPQGYVGWRCGKCGAPVAGARSVCDECGFYGNSVPATSQSESEGVGADPPWLEECRQTVFGYADARHRDLQYQTIRAVLAFAAKQPPSEAAIAEGAKALVPFCYSAFEDQRVDDNGAWVRPPGTPRDFARMAAEAVFRAAAKVRGAGG